VTTRTPARGCPEMKRRSRDIELDWTSDDQRGESAFVTTTPPVEAMLAQWIVNGRSPPTSCVRPAGSWDASAALRSSDDPTKGGGNSRPPFRECQGEVRRHVELAEGHAGSHYDHHRSVRFVEVVAFPDANVGSDAELESAWKPVPSHPGEGHVQLVLLYTTDEDDSLYESLVSGLCGDGLGLELRAELAHDHLLANGAACLATSPVKAVKPSRGPDRCWRGSCRACISLESVRPGLTPSVRSRRPPT
jgi:hypothetical protein